ncbi:hypothetical protein OCU04_001593 [Sclerotinia nivalis]|uniref:Uncharacterized protein n=1 Tax=Sclerotinia nivalis TaxID=352851 RepID=A0A9X0AZH9_9HELO|nr:hypothetical protein OCU04_001593 [Sclerotinia nivalis]
MYNGRILGLNQAVADGQPPEKMPEAPISEMARQMIRTLELDAVALMADAISKVRKAELNSHFTLNWVNNLPYVGWKDIDISR